MRSRDLASLQIGRHLKLPRSRRETAGLIYIPEAEATRGVAIKFAMPTSTQKMLERYIEQFRSRLTTQGASRLFKKSPDDRNRRYRVVCQIGDAVRRRTGLLVNGQILRLLAGQLYLERHPGSYEIVRRLLGNRRLENVKRNFGHLQVHRDLALFDRKVLRTNARTGKPGR
jgi:hypothetical protein